MKIVGVMASQTATIKWGVPSNRSCPPPQQQYWPPARALPSWMPAPPESPSPSPPGTGQTCRHQCTPKQLGLLLL